MDKDQIARLKELAEKATPGPWEAKLQPFNNVVLVLREQEMPYLVAMSDGRKNAVFIAAANPQAVLELIAEIERLEKEADWLVTWCADACDCHKGACDYCAFAEQSICPTEDTDQLADKPKAWREAARKVVAQSESSK